MVSRHNRLMRELYKKNLTADVQQPMRFNNPFLIQSSQVLLSNILKKQTMDAATAAAAAAKAKASAAAKATATAAPIVDDTTTPAAEAKTAPAAAAGSKPAAAAESKPAAEPKPTIAVEEDKKEDKKEGKKEGTKTPASGTGVSSRSTNKAAAAAKVKADAKKAAAAKAKVDADAKKAAAAQAKVDADAKAKEAKAIQDKFNKAVAAAKEARQTATDKRLIATKKDNKNTRKIANKAEKAATDAEAAATAAKHAHSPEPPVLDKTYKHLTPEETTTIKDLYKQKTELAKQLTALQLKNSQWKIDNKNEPKGKRYKERLISNTQKENAIGAKMNANNAKIKTLEDKETVGSTSGRRSRGRGTEPFETLTINSDGKFTPFDKSSTLYTALSSEDKTAYDNALKQSEVSQKAFKGLQEQTATRLASVADNTERKKITDDTEKKLKKFQGKYNDAIKTVTKIREKELKIKSPTTEQPAETGPFSGLSVRGAAGEFKGIDKKSHEYKDLLPEQKAAYNDAAKKANAAAKSFVTKTRAATKAYNDKKKADTKANFKTKTESELNDIRLRYNDAVEKAADALGAYGKRLRIASGTVAPGGD